MHISVKIIEFSCFSHRIARSRFVFILFFICNPVGLAVPNPPPLLDSNKYRAGLQRPFSFTHGVVPEATFSQALGAQLGIFFIFYFHSLHDLIDVCSLNRVTVAP